MNRRIDEKQTIDARKLENRCDLCGIKTKPGSRYAYMCRDSEACAHRRLKSAAPDLLAVAKEFQDASEYRADDQGHVSILISPETLKHLRAAIAKAEGK